MSRSRSAPLGFFSIMARQVTSTVWMEAMGGTATSREFFCFANMLNPADMADLAEAEGVVQAARAEVEQKTRELEEAQEALEDATEAHARAGEAVAAADAAIAQSEKNYKDLSTACLPRLMAPLPPAFGACGGLSLAAAYETAPQQRMRAPADAPEARNRRYEETLRKHAGAARGPGKNVLGLLCELIQARSKGATERNRAERSGLSLLLTENSHLS